VVLIYQALALNSGFEYLSSLIFLIVDEIGLKINYFA